MQRFDYPCCFFLPYPPALLVAYVSSLALYFRQTVNRVQCLFGQLTFVRDGQSEKIAAGAGHGAHFGNAFFKTGFVASKIVVHQIASPQAEEGARNPNRCGERCSLADIATSDQHLSPPSHKPPGLRSGCLCRLPGPYWYLDQRSALAAESFPNHMPLDDVHAGRVVQSPAHAFTEALKQAAVCAD